jgi:hypothetical protein
MTGTDTNATAQAPDDGVMGMDEAPERIWAVPLEMHGAVMVGGWADTIRQCPNGTEYVRADILAQTLAANAALEAVVAAGDGLAEAVQSEIDARQKYEQAPTDRGGSSGPKGQAYKAWLAAIAALLTTLTTYRAAKDASQ